MKRDFTCFLVVFLVLMICCTISSQARDKVAPAPSNADFIDINFLRSGLPVAEWMRLMYGYPPELDSNPSDEADEDGIEPTPWYVPPEEFSPEANKPVILDTGIGPNTLVNSRDLCGSRGIVQSETSMAAYGDVIVIAFNDSRGFYCSGRSTLGWAFSYDGGQTFYDGGTLPGGRTPWSNGDPALAVGPDGTFYIAGIGNGFRTMSFSRGYITKDGIVWTPPVPAVRGTGTIDKEFLAVDQITRRVYMAYSRSQTVEVIYSDDEGDSWSNPTRLSGGLGAFPAIGPNGEVYVAWLAGWPSANQRVVVARSDNGGATFSAPVTIATVCPVNIAGFNRGQMPAFPSLAIDLSGGDLTGRVYVAWHSQCNTGSSGNVRLSWSDNNGQSWSTPAIINDGPTTAHHFSPSVSVDDYGNVNVVFYDRRNNPGTGTTNVYFAQSVNGGASFSPNVRVTEMATNWSATPSDITPNFGDYMSSLSTGSDVLLTWTDGRSGDPDTYFARISTASLAKE